MTTELIVFAYQGREVAFDSVRAAVMPPSTIAAGALRIKNSPLVLEHQRAAAQGLTNAAGPIIPYQKGLNKMQKLTALLIAAAALLALVFIVIKASQPSYPSAAELAAEQLTIERMHAIAPAQTAAAAIWALLPPLAALGFVAVALSLSLSWGVAALRRYKSRELVRPDGAGLLPILLDSLPSAAPAALGAFHAAQLASAQRPILPAHLTYSPRLDYRADSSRAALLAADEPAALPAPGLVPSFAQLLDQGAIGQGRPMLLGYDQAGVAITGSWQQLYSCAVGGLSGSGKSTTVAFLAGQAVLHGARIVLLDPHAGDKQSLTAKLEPLAGRFLCAPASEPADMARAVALVADELRRRLAAPRGTEHAPLLFIADEFTALQRGALAEPLAALGEALGQEGRKVGLFGMFSGQIWSAARAGGTELRDSLASAYIHRLRPAQARMLSGLTADSLPADIMELPAGTAYLLDTSGDLQRVAIPLVAGDDLARIAVMLGGSTAAPQEGQPTTRPAPIARSLGFRVSSAEVGSGAASGAAQAGPLRGHPDAEQWTAEEAQIVALLAAGRGPREVVIELYGVKGGDAYSRAAAKVTAVIARLALRLHRPAA